MSRVAERSRKTSETEVSVRLHLDGSGRAQVETGIGFFDHMLDALARHGGLDLEVRCKGDLQVDGHHTVEDVGLSLGAAFREALGDMRGITRFADTTIPLDEALARAVVDISGRSSMHGRISLPADQPMIGDFDAALCAEFWRAFSTEARITLHIDTLRGENAHHLVEAVFKATARALRAAAARDPRSGDEIPSTKGVL